MVKVETFSSKVFVLMPNCKRQQFAVCGFRLKTVVLNVTNVYSLSELTVNRNLYCIAFVKGKVAYVLAAQS